MYTVYILQNEINKKKYVGITSQNPYKRWSRGKNYKKTSHIRKAIEKYGWDNFSHIIVDANLSKEEACRLETKLIKDYGTTDRLKGYNNSTGGEIGSLGNHHHLTEETKKKMSKAKKGKKHWWKSGGMLSGKYNDNKNRRKIVICIETQIEYNSLREASEKTGISKASISINANGKRNSGYAGKLKDGTKLHWQYKDI